MFCLTGTRLCWPPPLSSNLAAPSAEQASARARERERTGERESRLFPVKTEGEGKNPSFPPPPSPPPPETRRPFKDAFYSQVFHHFS